MLEKRENERRVFGPPGTGKTRYLSEVVHNAVSNKGVDPQDFLLSSFTKTAAKELASKELPIGKHQVGTLHSHTFHGLGKPTIAESKIDEFNEAFPDFALSEQSTNMDESQVDQQFASDNDANFSQYQIYRNRFVPRENWITNVFNLAKRWEDFKKQTGYMDFTDLIEYSITEMLYPPHNARIGIFDEVQDFTPLQLALIRQWANQMDYIMLAGDDDQTLFSFAGATPDAFLTPEIDEDHKKILDQSYRVPRVIQTLAQSIIEKVQKREPKRYKPRDSEGELEWIRADFKNPAPIARHIEQEISEGRTVMVLGACSYMLSDTVTELRERGIPFYNPYRPARGDWNPIKRGGTSTADRLYAYLNPTGPVFHGSRMWTLQELAFWIELLQTKGILQHGKKKLIQNKAKEVESLDIDDLLDFYMETFHTEALEQAVQLSPDWVMHNATANKQKALKYPFNVMRRDQDGLNKTPQTIVGTIHSVKGGQANTVILFPDLSLKATKAYIPGHGEGYDSVLRQFYVGVTRAQQKLLIAQPVNPKTSVREIR